MAPLPTNVLHSESQLLFFVDIFTRKDRDEEGIMCRHDDVKSWAFINTECGVALLPLSGFLNSSFLSIENRFFYMRNVNARTGKSIGVTYLPTVYRFPARGI